MGRISLLFIMIFIAGCVGKPLPPVKVDLTEQTIDYVREVKPVLERRCVVCHSCYNSPCQLKLSSFEGIDRGLTKKPVYDALRLTSMDPTRLFIDAKDTDEWRQKGFFSVTKSDAGPGYNNSLMAQTLFHKKKEAGEKKKGVSEGDYFPEKGLTCTENGGELGSFLEEHPNRGMPFGFPPLKEDEFNKIINWLAQGAVHPSSEQMQQMNQPSPGVIPEIAEWEEFLNNSDDKHQLTARYLYEHLFLAHIWFSAGGEPEFYELVRSTTSPGLPIEIIPSVRPYDDPQTGRFYYRFRRIQSTIVHKTHIVFELNKTVLARFKELFLEPQWDQEPHAVSYDPELSANPFAAFAQIPARSRYQFLLDNANYVIMTFIHGPVCKGQLALDVIHDHFWLMFLDPDYDLSVTRKDFLQDHLDDLKMPIEDGSNTWPFDYWIKKYHRAAVRFYHARQDFYATNYKDGLDFKMIWSGNRPEDAPLLTVFRHFDSGSVHKGVLGRLPRTMWVMDYPLLERIYYALVAGFDVFGNLSHQLEVRLYMDELRIEGESYLLDFLPDTLRKRTMHEWYEKLDFLDIGYFSAGMPTGIKYRTNDSKREFIERLVKEHIRKDTGIDFDRHNYLKSEKNHPSPQEHYRTMDDYMQDFRAVSAPGTAFLRYIDDHDANTAFIRIRMPDGNDQVVTMVIHRWHDNVKFVVGEELFEDSSKDQADFFNGFIGSYPNYFFDVKMEELPDFIALLHDFENRPDDKQRLDRYGVNRADDNFWEEYDWFQDRFNKEAAIHSGRFDLNRYYHKAIQPLGTDGR
jgi:hypothetical protein